MAKKQSIVQQPATNLVHQPQPEFRRNDFDAAIENRGRNVIWEKAVRCPCKTEGGSHRNDCHNCLGHGWVFINQVQTKMIIQSVNTDTKYKSWSEEKLGTATLTAFHDNQLSIYDRIIVLEDYSILSELRNIRTARDATLFVFPSYEPKELFEIFKFIGPEVPLERIPDDRYTLEGNTIRFTQEAGLVDDQTVSIRYKYEVQYHVIDLPKETRSQQITTEKGARQRQMLPVHAIARRSHVILDYPDYGGSNVIDNSYQ